MHKLIHADLTSQILGAAVFVHRSLGAGMLENTYQQCLAHLLRKRGLEVETEVWIPIEFEGLVIPRAYRIDMIIESKVILELKSVAAVQPVHKSQLLTYLRLTNLRVGLLINFHESHLGKGITRIVN